MEPEELDLVDLDLYLDPDVEVFGERYVFVDFDLLEDLDLFFISDTVYPLYSFEEVFFPGLETFEYLKPFFVTLLSLAALPGCLYTAPLTVFETPEADLTVLYFFAFRKPLFLYATVLPLALMILTLSRPGLILGANPLPAIDLFARTFFFKATLLMCAAPN